MGNDATCSCIQNGYKHVIRLPLNLDPDGVNELEFILESDMFILSPTWPG